MKAVLIHASLGAGHKRAAQALSERLAALDIKHEVRDLLTFLPPPAGLFYSKAYHSLTTDLRWLWKFFYTAMDRPAAPYAPAKSRLQRWQFSRLLNFLQREKPDFIICTHFTPAALLADWRQSKLLDCKVFSVVTDHVAHRCWKRTGLDHYFVASETVSSQLQTAGIPESEITVTGIPISEGFSKSIHRDSLRAEWNCGPEEILVLVLCSALTRRKAISLLREIQNIDPRLRFLVSMGPDPAKEKRVKVAFEGQNQFSFFGFSTRIAEMMKAADLVLTKPGGLTVSEALAAGVPMILLSPIPGQEEANARYAADHGAAICIEKTVPGCFASAIRQALSSPGKLSEMSRAAARIGRPDAARTILDKILIELTAHPQR